MKKPFIVLLVWIFLIGLVLPAFSQTDNPSSPADSKNTTDPATSKLIKASVSKNYVGRKYLLGPYDVISVLVYDSPEFDQQNVVIPPDGKVELSPIGAIDVAGMTIDELNEELTQRLKFYLRNPLVTIRLEHTKPFTVYVSGAVLKPGSYELVTDSLRAQPIQDNTPEVFIERKSPLLSNILVAAGGVTYDADLEHVKISNSVENTSFEINLLEFLEQGSSEHDLYLIAGDTVYVPRLSGTSHVAEEQYKRLLGSTIFERSIPVKVYGYVNNPGLVNLNAAQSANVNSAISAAGGFLKDVAYPGKVYVSRVDANGKLTTSMVDPTKDDMTLMPNDVVYVPEKPRPLVGKAFDYMARIIAPVSAFASTYNGWSLMFNPRRFQVNVSH